MSDRMQLTVVVPCYNEEPIIEQSGRRLLAYLEELADAGKISRSSSILFVNDGSTDGTWEILERLCGENAAFTAISLSRNFGHQAALLAGLHTAPGDAVISIDADLQDDISVMGAMLERFGEGFEVVYGVRRERKSDSAFKRWTALGFYRLMKLLGTRTVYNHADYRLLSRRAIETLRDYREVNLFLRGIVTLMGFRWAVVEYDRGKRLAGESKYPLGKMVALSVSAVTSFSNVPLRLITLVAWAGMCVLAGLAGWVLWVRMFTTEGVPGWASVLLPVLFLGCLNLLAMGILGEYIARIFDEVKARPRYVIAEGRNLAVGAESGWRAAQTK
jgi:glycosyltransferase involved in cell wall biosynthesis